MARRTRAVNVLGAGLLGLAMIGTPSLLAGCAGGSGGSRTVPEGVEYTVAVENKSKHAVDVSWFVAFRREDDGELGQPIQRTLGVIEPGDSGHDGPSVIATAPSTYGPGYVQVFRIRLTIPSASWQEPARMWWEVVGPLPRKFIVERGPGPDGFMVRLRADGAALEAVPRQFWTDESEP